MLVEPADFLIANIQPLTVLTASDDRRATATPEEVTMSSVLLEN